MGEKADFIQMIFFVTKTPNSVEIPSPPITIWIHIMSIETALKLFEALIFFLPLGALLNGPASEKSSEHSGWQWFMWLVKFDVGALLSDLTIFGFLHNWHLNRNAKLSRWPGTASKSS